jgi:hypothetical protein
MRCGEDVLSPKFVAEALTETGRRFTSNTLDVRLKRILGRTRTWVIQGWGKTLRRKRRGIRPEEIDAKRGSL